MRVVDYLKKRFGFVAKPDTEFERVIKNNAELIESIQREDHKIPSRLEWLDKQAASRRRWEMNINDNSHRVVKRVLTEKPVVYRRWSQDRGWYWFAVSEHTFHAGPRLGERKGQRIGTGRTVKEALKSWGML